MKISANFKAVYGKVVNWLCSEPKRLIRIVVLAACCVIVFFQLSECIKKLLNPPISTHSNFELNETMHYPAVTFCRSPAFKSYVMQKYNLEYHPSITGGWKDFPFENKTLGDLYIEATYNMDEFFDTYALDGNKDYVDVKVSLHFSYGRCYTLIPKTTTVLPWKESGYAVRLLHEQQVEGLDEYDMRDFGWNIYLHEAKEQFTEYGTSSSGRIENLFMETKEEMELKTMVHHYTQFRGRGSVCSDDSSRSASICRENCVWKYVEDIVGCSGPWVKKPTTPYCNSYNQMADLIVQYQIKKQVNDKECGCLVPCETTIYSSFVMNRKPYNLQSHLNSKIFIYYTSKMVTNLEEKSSYDSSQFLADLGGTLGFLLGLSVVGLIIVLEKLLGYLFLDDIVDRYKEKMKDKLAIDEKPQEKSREDHKKEANILDTE